MTRPPPPRRHTGLALAACGLLGVTALGLLTAHGITASAAVRETTTVDGAIPGPATAVTTASETRSDAPGAPGVTEGVRMVSGRTVTATATRWLPQSTRTVVRVLPGSVVTATRTATATRTETTTATATVTETVTAVPTSAAGVSP